MPIHLRELPDGTRFILCRTGERHTFVRRDTNGYGGTRYIVQRPDGGFSTLHHSCRVKPIVSPNHYRANYEPST